VAQTWPGQNKSAATHPQAGEKERSTTMTHDEAFLQAIIETPSDDTPRLIYADWLEDHDQPERAEFIRLQCRLAQMDDDDDASRELLETREQFLLERYQDEWLGPMRRLLCHWTFRRGYLDAVAVPARVFLAETSVPCPPTVRCVEVDLTGFEVPDDVLEVVPESVARENIMLPLGIRDKKLAIAMQEPTDQALLEKLEFILNRSIVAIAAPADQIAAAINHHYPGPDADSILVSERGGPSLQWPPSVIDQLLTLIIQEAFNTHASEIRIQPEADHLRIRYRIDGKMVDRDSPPRRLMHPIATRIRILAGLDVGKPGLLEKGRIALTVRDAPVDLRVSIYPSAYGPLVTLRFSAGPHRKEEPVRS